MKDKILVFNKMLSIEIYKKNINESINYINIISS